MGQQFRGADIVVRSLKRLGCERVFTLSGNHIMSLFDAALDAGLDLVHVRHEAAAVHMADAHGRLTGQPGVAMVTGGPGHANAVGALFTALSAESPMVLLSGHAATWELGRGGFQEIRQAEMAAPVSKASFTATSAANQWQFTHAQGVAAFEEALRGEHAQLLVATGDADKIARALRVRATAAPIDAPVVWVVAQPSAGAYDLHVVRKDK